MYVYLSLQNGDTALSMARANNQNDVVQYLLQHQPKWKVDTLALLQEHTYVVIMLHIFYIRKMTLLFRLTMYVDATFLLQNSLISYNIHEDP